MITVIRRFRDNGITVYMVKMPDGSVKDIHGYRCLMQFMSDNNPEAKGVNKKAPANSRKVIDNFNFAMKTKLNKETYASARN